MTRADSIVFKKNVFNKVDDGMTEKKLEYRSEVCEETLKVK